MRESCMHLVEELVIVCEHTFDELEGKCLVEVLKLKELGVLTIAKQAQVLKDGERVMHSRTKQLCGSVGKCDQFELTGKEHAAMLFDDPVDDEHAKLVQHGRRAIQWWSSTHGA
jgi:hypothetical protein